MKASLQFARNLVRCHGIVHLEKLAHEAGTYWSLQKTRQETRESFFHKSHALLPLLTCDFDIFPILLRGSESFFVSYPELAQRSVNHRDMTCLIEFNFGALSTALLEWVSQARTLHSCWMRGDDNLSASAPEFPRKRQTVANFEGFYSAHDRLQPTAAG